jgi:gas vesicle protein
MNSGKVFLGVVAGLAAGAALGVLLAPDKESKTRKIISKKTDELVDAINDKVERKVKELTDVFMERLAKAKKGDSTEVQV